MTQKRMTEGERRYYERLKKQHEASTCEHVWRTDGMHSNLFCAKCFISWLEPVAVLDKDGNEVR